MALRVALIGCVKSSQVALETLLQASSAKPICIVGVLTRRASTFNTDFTDLAPIASKAGIPILFADDSPSTEEQATWLASLDVDLIFCIGWSQLLSSRMLNAAKRGTIGFHPAALPANRGRHPLVWALALGLQETASTFFQMDDGADSGPILNQQPVRIEDIDDAASLYDKVLQVIPGQVEDILNRALANDLIGTSQNDRLANYWRKRTPLDGQIDWRMAASTIYNLVRALSKPYPGAHCLIKGEQQKIWKVEVITSDCRNIEPGKVLAVEGHTFTLKCGIDAVRVIEHGLAALPTPGEYL